MDGYSGKVKGSLLGAALGDGLGAFAECLHYKAVDRKYRSLPPDGFKGPIDYTDDTSLRLVVYDAILSAPINAFNLAEHWKTKVVDTSVYWTSELFVTAMISMRHDPHRIGHANLLADDAAMAADPFGVAYPIFDELAALRAFEALSICQSGKGLEGAMAVAAAVSRSMCPEPNMDDVVEAAGKWVSRDMKDRIERAVSLVSSDHDARQRLYEELLVEDGTSDLVWSDLTSPTPSESVRRLVDMGATREDISMGVSPLEVVPLAIGYVAKGRREPLNAIKEAAAFGRDSDTIAGITGSILGAYHGVNFLPQSYLAFLPSGLVAKSEELSAGLSKVASRFTELMRAESDRARRLFAD